MTIHDIIIDGDYCQKNANRIGHGTKLINLTECEILLLEAFLDKGGANNPISSVRERCIFFTGFILKRSLSPYTPRVMKYLFLILSLMTSHAFAQALDLMDLHRSMCATNESCRINVIPQKIKVIQGTCTGRLMDEYDCEVEFSASEQGSSVKILCRDGNGSALIDGFVLTGFLAYKVSAVIGKGANEKIKTDASSHLAFDHPAIKLMLKKKDDVVTGNVYFLMENQKRALENLDCRLTSESGPSSSAQAQSVNPT